MEADQSMSETKCFNAITPDWAPLERAVKLAGVNIPSTHAIVIQRLKRRAHPPAG